MPDLTYFSDCSTSTEQTAWLIYNAKDCPFCAGRPKVWLPGKEMLWEIGCPDHFGCVAPRSVHKDALTALRRWNMRYGKE